MDLQLSTLHYFRVILMTIMLLYVPEKALAGCENLPLGIQSGIIPDGSITASSAQYPAMNARLNYISASSWCASTSDSSPYLQIDLASSHLICAVATQGNSITDKWVKTYQINTSSDGTTWTTYQENNIDRTFYGNYDRTMVVHRLLYHGVIARYLRIVPKTYQGGTPCLRTEIYGYLFLPGCFSRSVGIPSSSLIPDHRFTATSEEGHNCCNPYKGRLGANPGWLPATDTAHDYLQVDLGDVFYICAVATQGHGGSYDEWVTRYKVLYSTNNKAWTTYRDQSGNEHEFNGNSDKTTVVTNPITNPFRAKFVRVFPTAYHNRKMIRIDFKGLPSGCTSSLGIENSQIPDSQMSSSSSDSSHTASRGRLYGSSSWCSSTTSNTEYIQVDLGQTKTVTGIATQGDNSLNKWVTSYKVSYSFDNRDWNEYKQRQVAKVFNGNSNKNNVIVNWFNRPIAARYVRILPYTSSGGHCLRFDLYGCAVFVIPKVILDAGQVILPAIKGTNRTLSCSVLGEPTPDIQWFNNGTKINGATQPTLQVQFQFISAEDVLSKSNCTRQDPSTRAVVCNTFYTCRIVNPVHLPSGGINEVTGKVTVNLNVPEPPNLTASPYKGSITVTWNIVPRDDVGHIISYTVQFNNESTVVTYRVQHPAVNYSLEYLKPYTSYRIRMNAISSVGQGLWSSWLSVTTSISERRTTEYTNSTLWALQGDELTIGCYTSGDEPITYFWTKTGSLIVDSSVAKARGSDLIISLESDKDFGTYVCTATNSERTVVYRINKVKLKKYSTCKCTENTRSQSKAKEIVPYVIPLALIILLLIICIVYLVYRQRKDKKYYQEGIDEKMDDITNEKKIKIDVINQSRYPDDAIQFQRRQPTKPDPATANKIEHPTYMELKPTQDNNSIYQEPLNKPRKTASPQMQGTGHGEYMDLKPRENTGYETLHHQNLVRAKDYETINYRGFYKNVSIDDTEV